MGHAHWLKRDPTALVNRVTGCVILELQLLQCSARQMVQKTNWSLSGIYHQSRWERGSDLIWILCGFMEKKPVAELAHGVSHRGMIDHMANETTV